MDHYGLNKIKLAFDAQYKIVILTYLLTYLLSAVGLGLCLENAGVEAIPAYGWSLVYSNQCLKWK